MFEDLDNLPDDPILGLMSAYRQDPNPSKVDLGVGVYKDEKGRTPILSAVRSAEIALLEEQSSKSYVAPRGNALFLEKMSVLCFGESIFRALDERLASIQTPGGCGALRLIAELIKTAKPGATIWVSDPTWGNHQPLLGDAGLNIKTYPYYDYLDHGLQFDAMEQALTRINRGDVVLLHGCCHNPTGTDLSQAQWYKVAAILAERGVVPLLDIAYLGFGENLEADAWSLRLMCEQCPEVLVAVSCSKNFAVYRERVGAALAVCSSTSKARSVSSHMQAIARGMYSMPPDYGAELVARVLVDDELRCSWVSELDLIRNRIVNLRTRFAEIMRDIRGDSRFDFVASQRGMFSFLGLTEAQVTFLIERRSIYMLDSSRASIPGLNRGNLNYVCESVNLALAN